MASARLAILMLAFGLCACTHTRHFGQPIDDATIAQLQLRVTTQAQVVALLGTPQTKQIESSGKQVWTYDDVTTEGTIANVQQQVLPHHGRHGDKKNPQTEGSSSSRIVHHTLSLIFEGDTLADYEQGTTP
jgi:outer membrane protein assembly factor BamE (lipoprotein component of BamABCDE complex)